MFDTPYKNWILKQHFGTPYPKKTNLLNNIFNTRYKIWTLKQHFWYTFKKNLILKQHF
jgi:hypothetical protein